MYLTELFDKPKEKLYIVFIVRKVLILV